MADNRLSEIITKIKRTEKLNAIDFIELVDQIESNINKTENSNLIHLNLLTRKDIKEIIQGYKLYPLYLIKYIFTIYPKTSSSLALDNIIMTKERRSDLIECILTAFSVRLCEIPDINFDCRIVMAHKTISETRDDHQMNMSDLRQMIDIDDNELDNESNNESNNKSNTSSVQNLIDVIEEIETLPNTRKTNKICNCMDRRHWSELYNSFVNLIEGDDRFLFESYNVNYSITNLVAQTDVANEELSKIIKKSIDRPDRWRAILMFIKKTGLVSSAYGDMIFSIRDAIILNNRKKESERDQNILKFRELTLLSSLLKRYNEYHKNMSKITNNMYITDINGARNTDLIRDKKINCIVSLTKKTIFKASNVRYFHIQMDDIESVDFLSMTLDTADKVIELIQKDQVILVHCYKGVSRSVSFVILVLVKQGIPYDEALEFVKRKRPSANPNPAFREQLKDYSKRVNRR